MLIPSGQVGETVKEEGKVVEKEYSFFNTDLSPYCWLHNLTLHSDWKNPNEEDKKKLEEIRLKEYEITEKDGTIIKARMCPKCRQIVRNTNG